MFSKVTELAGMAVFALGVAYVLGDGAALIVGGAALVFVGSQADDDAVAAKLRRGWGWVRYAYWKTVARESGVEAAMAKPDLLPTEVPCECVRFGEPNPECPICYGVGVVPNPNLRVGVGPHPPLDIEPMMQEAAHRLAEKRRLRGDGRIREGRR